MEMKPVETHRARQPLGEAAFYGLAAALTFSAYWAVLYVSNGGNPFGHALASLRNLIPLAVLTAAVRPLLQAQILRWPIVPQLTAHALVGIAFSCLWYWMLMVLIGLSTGESLMRFSVRPFFPGPASVWQLLQGLTVYALVAALVRARMPTPLPAFILSDGNTGEPRQPALSRLFVRLGEEIHPIDVNRIVSISGADDYAEIVTLEGRHLVRMTLSEFEKALEGEHFLRVHRSRIVNVHRIARAESAGGGRMLLHMENGEMIQASRAGSRLLRDRVI